MVRVPRRRAAAPVTVLAFLGILLTACTGGSTVSGSPATTPAGLTAGPSSPAASTGQSAAPSASVTPTPTHTTARPSSSSAKPKATPKPTRSVAPGHLAYAFPVRCSSAISYGHSHHDYPATDIFAAVGCLVVSPVTGTVDEVSRVDTWSSSANLGATRGGLSFSIIGVDGVRYYGSHLSVLLSTIRPGVHVVAGQLIGKVGKSGDAVGGPSHLHFGLSWPTRPGMWWIRRGEVYPWPYLDAWRRGIAKSPAAAVALRKAQVGNAPCSVDC